MDGFRSESLSLCLAGEGYGRAGTFVHMTSQLENRDWKEAESCSFRIHPKLLFRSTLSSRPPLSPGSRVGRTRRGSNIEDQKRRRLCVLENSTVLRISRSIHRRVWTTSRETAAEYAKQVTALARRLMAVISENLGLRADYLNDAFQAHAFTYINNNFYPVCPEPTRTLGLSGHSDPGGITILYQDEVGGLQAQKSGGPWVDVAPVRNAFVVNLADQIQIISNGKYRSGMHRVVVNSQQPRYSIAAIFSPDAEAKISPAGELLSSGLLVRMYPEISFADMVGYVKNGAYEKGFLNSLLLPTGPSHPTP